MAISRIIISIACLCVSVGVFGAHLDAPPALSQAGTNCRYEFTVPDKAGMCNSGNAALDDKIKNVKEDLDRTRLQYVSQNTIVQEQMSKLQNNINSYGSQVNDLYSHIRQIQSQVSKLPSSQGSGNSDLQKLVQTTKDSFNKALHDIENKLFNVTYNFQKDAIEQSKVNAAVEMQVRLQDERTKILEGKMKDLLKTVTNIPTTTSTSSGPSTVSPAILNQVRSRLKQFDQQIQMYDQLQSQQFSALQMKTNELALKLSNHSHVLNDLSVEGSALLYKTDAAQQSARKAKTDLDDFQADYVPKINRLMSDMTIVKANTSDLRTMLDDVAAKALDADILGTDSKMSISDLNTRMSLLTIRIREALNQLSNQSTSIDDLSADLHSLESTLDPAQLKAMQTAIKTLKNTGNLGSVTKSELEQVETEIQNLKKIVTALEHVPPVPVTGSAQEQTTEPFIIPTKKEQPVVVPTLKKDITSTEQPFIVPPFKTPNMGPVTPSPPFLVPTLPQSPKLQTTPAYIVPVLPGRNKK